MSQYQKSCMFCNKEIRMSNDTGKWLPMNLDGGFHSCKKVEVKAKDNNKDKQEPMIVVNQQEQLTLEGLDIRLKKIEEILKRSLWKTYKDFTSLSHFK